MSLALVATRAQLGVAAPAVTVEVHLAGGLPGTSIVGLPEAAVREARDRVRAALIASQWDYPQRRVTINLAPADLPKHGSRFDLAIALGILAASAQIPPAAFAGTEFLGELALSGELRAVSGVLPAVIRATQAGNAVIVPAGNAAEATLVRGAEVRVAKHLLEVCAHLREVERLPRLTALDAPLPEDTGPDLIDVRGQALARRALEIAAAGAHNLLMIGPPGSGKTMLATRLAGILPSMTEDEALETAAVASVAGYAPEPTRLRVRATRAPHHSASAIALVGGGGGARRLVQHREDVPQSLALGVHDQVVVLDDGPIRGGDLLRLGHLAGVAHHAGNDAGRPVGRAGHVLDVCRQGPDTEDGGSETPPVHGKGPVPGKGRQGGAASQGNQGFSSTTSPNTWSSLTAADAVM